MKRIAIFIALLLSTNARIQRESSGRIAALADAQTAQRLAERRQYGSQVLLATHSPVLAALPGARIYELSGNGFTRQEWADLDLVQDWQAFFDDPARLLHHLLD